MTCPCTSVLKHVNWPVGRTGAVGHLSHRAGPAHGLNSAQEQRPGLLCILRLVTQRELQPCGESESSNTYAQNSQAHANVQAGSAALTRAASARRLAPCSTYTLLALLMHHYLAPQCTSVDTSVDSAQVHKYILCTVQYTQLSLTGESHSKVHTYCTQSTHSALTQYVPHQVETRQIKRLLIPQLLNLLICQLPFAVPTPPCALCYCGPCCITKPITLYTLRA